MNDYSSILLAIVIACKSEKGATINGCGTGNIRSYPGAVPNQSGLVFCACFSPTTAYAGASRKRGDASLVKFPRPILWRHHRAGARNNKTKRARPMIGRPSSRALISDTQQQPHHHQKLGTPFLLGWVARCVDAFNSNVKMRPNRPS